MEELTLVYVTKIKQKHDCKLLFGFCFISIKTIHECHRVIIDNTICNFVILLLDRQAKSSPSVAQSASIQKSSDSFTK